MGYSLYNYNKIRLFFDMKITHRQKRWLGNIGNLSCLRSSLLQYVTRFISTSRSPWSRFILYSTYFIFFNYYTTENFNFRNDLKLVFKCFHNNQSEAQFLIHGKIYYIAPPPYAFNCVHFDVYCMYAFTPRLKYTFIL